MTPVNLLHGLHSSLGVRDDAGWVPMRYQCGPLQTLEIFISGIIRELRLLAGNMQEVFKFSTSQVAIIFGRTSKVRGLTKKSHEGEPWFKQLILKLICLSILIGIYFPLIEI